MLCEMTFGVNDFLRSCELPILSGLFFGQDNFITDAQRSNVADGQFESRFPRIITASRVVLFSWFSSRTRRKNPDTMVLLSLIYRGNLTVPPERL